MSYNAGDKVSVVTAEGTAPIKATIVGVQFGGLHDANRLLYRDNCQECQQSSLSRHRIGDRDSYIV